jgi:hypothetical protein
MELPSRFKLLTDPSSSFNIKKSGHLYEVESVNFRDLFPAHLDGVKRGQIKTFSRGSRRRMIKQCSSFGERKPIFGTNGYDNPIPSIKEAKKHNDRFLTKLHRDYPAHWVVWRMEFDKNGRIHFHYLVYSKEGKTFISHQWWKRNWRHVTGRPSLRPEVKGMRSHRGGIYYASKYLCKEDEEGFEKYKALFPLAKVGRFWGVTGRKNIPMETKDYSISHDDFKWLILHLAKDKAERSYKRDLRKDGNSWEIIEAMWGSDDWDKEVLTRTKKLFQKNGFPTWTLSDQPNYIERTIRTSRLKHDATDIDFVFPFC